MNNIIILIPPSEGKTAGGSKPPLKKFSQETQFVVNQWQSVSREQWAKALSVKNKTLDKALDANKNIAKSKTLPAIERYSGVVYNGIDYDNLSAEAKNFFNRHVRIVSAVFGLVKPQDCIPDYKCKINNFALDKHWKEINARLLKDTFVIDLLPQAHKKAIEYRQGQIVEFSILKKGKKAPAGHQGKHIKGRFVRYLAEKGQWNDKVMKGFKEDGFVWSDDGYVKKI